MAYYTGAVQGCSKVKPKLKELIRYSTKVSRCWKSVALELNLPEDRVDTIDVNRSTVEDKCYDMFRTWLQIADNPAPCWCQLVNAFQLAGLSNVAKEAKEAHLASGGNILSSPNLSSTSCSTEHPQIIATMSNYHREYYKNMRHVPEKAEWPPNQFKLHVSVAFIHYKSGQTQKELLEIIKPHDIDVDADTHSPSAKRQRLSDNKATKTLSDIFSPDYGDHKSNNDTCNSPKSVLIEGAPGIGKTVLAQEIASLWAKNVLLKDIVILFLFYLRDPRLWKVTTVKQLIQYLPIGSVLSDDEVSQCVSALMHCKVGFIFDGFDEYPQQSDDPLIEDLIFGRTFPDAVVVCTSRPTATLDMRNHVDRWIKILGFSREERQQYIALSLPKSPEKIDEVNKYFKANPKIDYLCSIPLHLAILMYLFKQGSLPETLTELNESFIVHTVYRNMKRHRLNIPTIANKIRDFPMPVLNVVNKLSQLAYEGLQAEHLIFSSDEVMQTCPEVFGVKHAINGFGILHAVQHYPVGGAGTTTSFNFLHFTMQEFLAAYYVSMLPKEQQLTLLRCKFWINFFHYMWIMYVGIVGVDSSAFVEFVESYKINTNAEISFKFQNDKLKCLHLLQCYAEAKSKEIPNVLSKLFADGNIIIDNANFLPHDFLSITSFISKSNLQVKSLGFDYCFMEKESVYVLKQFFSNNVDKVSVLKYVSLRCFPSSPWEVFCTVIKHTLVANLTLCGNKSEIRSTSSPEDKAPGEIEDYTIALRSSLQENKTLKSLTLCDVALFDLNSVKKAIIETVNLINTLNISTDVIGVEEIAAAKAEIISTNYSKIPVTAANDVLTINVLNNKASNCTPESINLSGQTSMAYQLSYVAFGLQNNLTITAMNISSCGISDAAGAGMVIECIQNSTTMNELNISNNQISGKLIAEILIIKSPLLKLDVSQNNIGSHGVKYIRDAIKVNNTLQELYIFYNEIGMNGAHYLAEGIAVNVSIQKLDVSLNKILDDGAIALCNCFKSNITLQNLNISWNKITDKGAEGIAQSIVLNVKLQVLGMSGNRITSEGIIFFLDTIKSCTSLTTLFVRYNNVTMNGLVQISHYIERLRLSFAVHTTWNDIVVYHKQVAIKSSYHSFDSSNLESFNPNDASGYVWLIEFLEDKEYAMVLLSACLKDNSTLQELNLQKCELNITTKGAKQIAAALKVNKTLQKFNISSHHIGNDGAIAICQSLKYNNSLQYLNLARTGIYGDGTEHVLNALQANEGLVKLDISGNSLRNRFTCHFTISDYIQNNATLKELYLSSTHISDDMEEIIKSLNLNTSLQKLVISNNYCYQLGTIISKRLKNNCTLVEFDVSHCSIRGSEMNNIVDTIQISTGVQKLNVSSNRGVSICDCIKFDSSLKKLNLAGINFDDNEAKLIGNHIIQYTTLEQLNISHNKLSYEAVETISKYLKTNCTLLKFNISGCHIGSGAVKWIAEAIAINTTLQKLDMSRNRLCDNDVASVANSLMQNATIRNLNLSRNNITSSVATNIAEVLNVNSTLQKLDISYNRICDAGMEPICESLMRNNTLTKLDMSYNQITSTMANKIAEVIQVNTGLCKLNVYIHHIFPDKAVNFNMTVLGAMHKNKTIISLKLPHTHTSRLRVLNEIDNINKERTRQGIAEFYTNAVYFVEMMFIPRKPRVECVIYFSKI